jgi:hypothetical protein
MDEEKFKKVVDILAKYRNTDKFEIKVGKNGVGVGIDRNIEEELKECGITNDEVGNITKKILEILGKKIIEDIEPEKEYEKYVIEKLYSNNLREKFLLLSTQINPVFDDIEVITTLKEKDGIAIKSYTVKITIIDENGKQNVIKFECIEEDIKKIKNKLNI